MTFGWIIGAFISGAFIGAFIIFVWLQNRQQSIREDNIRLMAQLETDATSVEKFEGIAQKILGGQSEKNRERLEKTLLPFQQNLNSFRDRLEDLHRQNAEGHSALNKHIENLHDTSLKLSEETTGLTEALRHDKKMQGDWGEVILERILEQSGLEKGREYETQAHYKNEEGKRLRPDVIIHLPDEKDIIIDAKVSLNAYADYVNATDNEERERYMKQHLLAINRHVDSLSNKDYEKLVGIRSLNYVLLFFPIEAAFIVAQQRDSQLFERALQKHIILVIPTTLLATLKVIHNIWSNEKRNQNAVRIAEEGGALYDKLCGFVNDMDNVDKSFHKAHSSLNTARKKLSEGTGNLIRRAEKMKELGANAKKKLSHL